MRMIRGTSAGQRVAIGNPSFFLLAPCMHAQVGASSPPASHCRHTTPLQSARGLHSSLGMPPLQQLACSHPPSHPNPCCNDLLVQSLHRSISSPAVAAAAGQLRQLHFCGKHAALLLAHTAAPNRPLLRRVLCAMRVMQVLWRRLFRFVSLRCTAVSGAYVGRGLVRRSACGGFWDCSAGCCAWAALRVLWRGSLHCRAIQLATKDTPRASVVSSLTPFTRLTFDGTLVSWFFTALSSCASSCASSCCWGGWWATQGTARRRR